jgi:hypothetical protein
MSPPVADEDDHSAKSKENQALPLPVSLRQYLPYEHWTAEHLPCT